MTIEIRQMMIKSTVLQKASEEVSGDSSGQNMDTMKESILVECRQLFLELLREQRER
ncbi:MAG: hypothetical protein OJF50_003791 [Nitrospira sp.]|jgi:hypothetical protein|nr:hypothetical protein [Nitrospira sp.]